VIKKCEWWIVLATCAAVAWFYVWTVRSSGESWDFGEEKRDYYNLLIDGYLDGQLHMKVDVPEALLKLRDPYDPQQRPAGLGLHDASFYKGRYYVYFGAAPMLALMLPFRVVTGMDLPLPVAILVFVYAGFLTSVGIWLSVRRRYFVETHTLTVVLGVMVLGLGGLCPVLLRRPDMWELPIAGGYCFAMLSLGAVWRSLHSERFAARWFAGAGFFLGLAIWSRPTYLVAAPLLVPPLLWWWRERRRPPWQNAFAAMVPLVAVGALMAGHNYARFEDPLQFGQAYQFSLDYESTLPHFAARYVPFTTKAHFFSTAQWSPYFPFLHRPDLGEAPAGFTIHRGDVYGILSNFPFAWLAVLTPLALWRRPALERGTLGAWLGSVALLFVLVSGFLVFFFSALARYQMDFAPALMLLAGIGMLGLERWLQVAGIASLSLLARIGWISVAVFSVVFGILVSLGFDGLLREHNPQLEQRFARTLNRIPAAFERLLGIRHGPLELTVRFPKAVHSGRETLLTVGETGRLDRVFVQYTSDGGVQLGVTLAGKPEQLSRPLMLAMDSPHRIQVTLGDLFPPPMHPMFSQKSAAEIRRATGLVCVRVNGEPVILDRQRIRSLNSGKIAVGNAALVDPAHPRFHGEIMGMRRMEEFPSYPRQGLFARLRLTLPPASSDATESLIGFGDAESGVLLGLKRDVTDRVRFVLRGPRSSRATSDPVAIGPGAAHEIVVRMDAGPVPARPAIYLWFDGQLVWVREVGASAPFTRPGVIGKNIVNAPEVSATFRGEIFSVQQDPAGRDPLQAGGDTLRARLRFPIGQAGKREPLVVTGSTGQADLLVVEYVDEQTIRFGLDHWGSPIRMSPPCAVDYANVHELEIAMAPLDTVADAAANPETRSGRLRLTLNGSVVWEDSAEFFPAERGEVTFGRNSVGGTNCGPNFTGEVLDVSRMVRE
jgi:hypothetical protein